ncbi:copper amine oxidase [Rhizoctonia solani]|nr:copper amine oxidase [Rhizoctonia solani]
MYLNWLQGNLLSQWFSGIPTCPADGALSITAPKINIWAPLSHIDTQNVQEWLYQQEKLNLTRMGDVTLSDNMIWLIESIMPNKTDALNYLDGNGDRPSKYARAVLYMGGLSIPVIQEYMVGPLPVSFNTTYTPFSYVYQNSTAGIGGSGAFPWNSRFFVASFMIPMANLTEDLIGGSFTGSDQDTLTYSFPSPSSLDGNWRRYWLYFMGAGNGVRYLGATGFFVNIDVSGTDPSMWSVRQAPYARIVYNHQTFNSTDELVDAYTSGTLRRGVKPNLKNHDWSTRKRTDSTRALDDRVAPRSVLFGGSRIKADKEAQYVEWMGWSFYLGFNRDTGLAMWDIKFKGERIIYELSLQEAMSHYSGNDPASKLAYLDRIEGIGQGTRQLLQGFDCPYGALTLDATYHLEGEYHNSPGAICIFEADLGFPTSRHGDIVDNWYGSTRGNALTVRTMTTVDNYDYIFDHILYLEGSVEATYWDNTQADYGTRIHETTMGSIHSHVINYRIDLDIVGTANSLQANTVFVEEVNKPWLDVEFGPTRQLRVNRTWIPTEHQTKFGANGQTTYLIANKNETNQWGYPRAYRFQPGLHSIYHAVQGAPILLNNARWAEWDLMVAKRKDTEPFSSTTWNQHLPSTPPVDFSKFFAPPESIDHEDLVIYANLGMHHLPRAEDIPNTLFTDTRSSFILSPFNYFDEEPSRDIRNAVLLQANKDGKYVVQEPSVAESMCAPLVPPGVDYIGQMVLDV